MAMINTPQLVSGFEDIVTAPNIPQGVDPYKQYPITFFELASTNGNLLGNTFAHLCALNGRIWYDLELLRLRNAAGETVAHAMAKGGNLTTDADLLLMRDVHGNLPIHLYANNGHDCSQFTETQLMTRGAGGATIYHMTAAKGHHLTAVPEKWNLLTDDGMALAHFMAAGGYSFDGDWLKLRGGHDVTPAHFMAECGTIFTELETLQLATTDGWTVAHEAADTGNLPPESTWRFTTTDGWTVAHAAARRGHIFTDQTILDLTDNDGLLVSAVEVVVGV